MREAAIAFVDYIENFTSNFCKVLQVALMFTIFVLLTAFAYFFINQVFKAKSNAKISPYQMYAYLLVGLWILYNIVFNYVMSYCIGPGYPQQIESPRFIQQVQKRCKRCSERKPQRCHHCSICNKCILQMDHHCPWMGTCVGHLNRRFFVNFLTYLCFGIALILFLIQKAHIFGVRDIFTFLLVLLLTLGGFGGFHWMLIFSGRTTLEICFIPDDYRPECGFQRNLQIVYGTANIFKIFLPVCRKLPFEGFQWSDPIDDNSNQIMSERI